MKVACLLDQRFTALDGAGTFPFLAAAPGLRSVFVATPAGAVADDTGSCPLVAAANFVDVGAPTDLSARQIGELVSSYYPQRCR